MRGFRRSESIGIRMSASVTVSGSLASDDSLDIENQLA